jgi:hypothetical protein
MVRGYKAFRHGAEGHEGNPKVDEQIAKYEEDISAMAISLVESLQPEEAVDGDAAETT